jgi:hypothetical protein
LVDFTVFKVSAAAAARPQRAEGEADVPSAIPRNRAPFNGGQSSPDTHSHAAPYMVAAGMAVPPRATPGLSDLQVLMATFDEHLCSARLDFLSPRLFLDFLERYRLGGMDEGSRARCLQEALQIGVLKEEKVWLGDREGLRVQPNLSNPIVVRYRQVRDALFGAALAKPLHPTDSFRPKRSFVVSTIVRATPALDPDEVHRWLDWFVQRGVLLSSYERLPKDLQAANILKMNTEHPMSQALLAASIWERISSTLMVLSVDSMLRLPKRPWVALSLLLRRIGDVLPVSREELRTAVGRALQSGLLIKQEYPNPRRPEPTSGVYLGEAEEVRQILHTARDFVSRSIELARPTGHVPISFLIQQCATAGLCEGSYDQVKDWITVLEKSGLLVLRGVPHPALSGQTMTVVSPDAARCRALLGEVEAAVVVEAASETPPESSDVRETA